MDRSRDSGGREREKERGEEGQGQGQGQGKGKVRGVGGGSRCGSGTEPVHYTDRTRAMGLSLDF